MSEINVVAFAHSSYLICVLLFRHTFFERCSWWSIAECPIKRVLIVFDRFAYSFNTTLGNIVIHSKSSLATVWKLVYTWSDCPPINFEISFRRNSLYAWICNFHSIKKIAISQENKCADIDEAKRCIIIITLCIEAFPFLTCCRFPLSKIKPVELSSPWWSCHFFPATYRVFYNKVGKQCPELRKVMMYYYQQLPFALTGLYKEKNKKS